MIFLSDSHTAPGICALLALHQFLLCLAWWAKRAFGEMVPKPNNVPTWLRLLWGKYPQPTLILIFIPTPSNSRSSGHPPCSFLSSFPARGSNTTPAGFGCGYSSPLRWEASQEFFSTCCLPNSLQPLHTMQYMEHGALRAKPSGSDF